jgi:hypothetical protein
LDDQTGKFDRHRSVKKWKVMATKRKPAMSTEAESGQTESHEQAIVNALEQLDAIQSGILERYGGSLTREQTESLGELMRLEFHLRGPDDQLDKELYSRALPPPRSTRSHNRQ